MTTLICGSTIRKNTPQGKRSVVSLLAKVCSHRLLLSPTVTTCFLGAVPLAGAAWVCPGGVSACSAAMMLTGSGDSSWGRARTPTTPLAAIWSGPTVTDALPSAPCTVRLSPPTGTSAPGGTLSVKLPSSAVRVVIVAPVPPTVAGVSCS